MVKREVISKMLFQRLKIKSPETKTENM